MGLSRRAALVVGVVTLVLTVPNVEEGLRAAVVFAYDREWLLAGIGLLAGLAGLGLLAVGVRLCARGLAATRLAWTAAAISVVAHAAGIAAGLMGLAAGLIGVVYPAILLALLRGTPSTAAPAAVADARPDTTGDEPKDQRRLRAATA